MEIDPDQSLLWRMNPRRLDIEAYRDSLLQATGNLDLTHVRASVGPRRRGNRGAPSTRASAAAARNDLLQLYDFPDADRMHSPGANRRTTPLQQLFVMNSPFMQEQAAALAEQVAENATLPRRRSGRLYRKSARAEPDSERTAISALSISSQADVARSTPRRCCRTNEVIFWP